MAERFWKKVDAIEFLEDEIYFVNMQRVAALRRDDDKGHRYWKDKLKKMNGVFVLLKELLEEAGEKV